MGAIWKIARPALIVMAHTSRAREAEPSDALRQQSEGVVGGAGRAQRSTFACGVGLASAAPSI